jgi:hypothetical protein
VTEDELTGRQHVFPGLSRAGNPLNRRLGDAVLEAKVLMAGLSLPSVSVYCSELGHASLGQVATNVSAFLFEVAGIIGRQNRDRVDLPSLERLDPGAGL